MIATLMAGMDTTSLTEKGVSAETLAKTIAQLTQAAEEEKKSGRGTGRKGGVRKEWPAEDRCMARTWGSAKAGNLGMGPQCSSKKCGGDYCKMHAKLAAQTETPCQRKEGKKFGLFMGRFDQPLQGKDSDGKWQITWLCPTIQQELANDKESGTYEEGWPTKEPSSGPKKPRVKKEKAAKKEKTPKAPRGKNAYMFYLESRRAAINTEILAAGTAEGATEEAKGKLTKTGKVKVSEVTKVAGAEWKALDADAKKPFETQSAADKAAKLKAFQTEQATALTSEPASPPVAPVSPTVAPLTDDESDEANAQAQALIAQLQGGDGGDIFGDDDSEVEEDENEAFAYQLKGEHVGLCADGNAIVCVFGEKNYVVTDEWYQAADDDAPGDEGQVSKACIGMLENLKEGENGDIDGDFVVKA